MAEGPRFIAVVDDDGPVLKALGRLLRGRGYDTATYNSAGEFLAALPDAVPDCLILDLQMPEMNGLELLKLLKRRGFDVPTIVITANRADEIADRCRAAGAGALLHKPLQNQPLLAAIDAIGKPRA